VTIINESTCYELSKIVLNDEKNIQYYSIKKDEQNIETIEKIAVLSKNNTYIALPIEERNNQIYIKEINALTPRLFCDFPLIGTEDFAFPVIINSCIFNPNEPRNGIYLTDKSDIKVDENKSIILDALDLYFTLLEYASSHNWANIYLLAKVPSTKEKEWFSKKWLDSSVVDPIRYKILKTPIVDTENNERIAILNEDNSANVWFPSAQKEDLRNKIWELTSLWIPSKLPRKIDVNIWYKIIWKGYIF
jgi:hypothetical protein